MFDAVSTLAITSPEFGSAIVWLFLTFPAYWLFQWLVEHEPFRVF